MVFPPQVIKNIEPVISPAREEILPGGVTFVPTVNAAGSGIIFRNGKFLELIGAQNSDDKLIKECIIFNKGRASMDLHGINEQYVNIVLPSPSYIAYYSTPRFHLDLQDDFYSIANIDPTSTKIFKSNICLYSKWMRLIRKFFPIYIIKTDNGYLKMLYIDSLGGLLEANGRYNHFRSAGFYLEFSEDGTFTGENPYPPTEIDRETYRENSILIKRDLLLGLTAWTTYPEAPPLTEEQRIEWARYRDALVCLQDNPAAVENLPPIPAGKMVRPDWNDGDFAVDFDVFWRFVEGETSAGGDVVDSPSGELEEVVR